MIYNTLNPTIATSGSNTMSVRRLCCLLQRMSVVIMQAAVIFALVTGSFSVAQTNFATVNGRVIDATGAAVPGATVIVTSTTTGIQKTTTTGEDGTYTVLDIDPGTYDIQARASGFSTSVLRNQVLLVAQKFIQDFNLKIASVSTSVQVQAVTQALSTTESAVAPVVEPQEVDNLPTINRSFSDLAQLSPGVRVAPSTSLASNSASSISIGDAQTFQTGAVMDGITAAASFSGGFYLNFAEDWIQEFSVVEEQPSAEYGQASGGVINAVTKSGGNQIHGRVYSYFQNAALNASPNFLPASEPTKPPYDVYRVGGMAGGPIKKDKLFYFAGYEYYHSLESIPVSIPAAFVATAGSSGVFPQTATTNIAMAKIDYQHDPNNRFTGRFNYEYNDLTNQGIGPSGTSVHTLGNGTDTTEPFYLLFGNWEKTISSSEINQLMFSFGKLTYSTPCKYAEIVGLYPNYPSQAGSTPFGDPVGWDAQVTYPQAGVVTGCTANHSEGTPVSSGLDQGTRDLNLLDTFTFIAGHHTVKVGANIGYEDAVEFNIRNNTDGEYSINGTSPFNAATAAASCTLGVSGNCNLFPTSDAMNGYSSLDYGQHGNIWGPEGYFFAQDSFKATSHLTLNAGIRYDISLMNSWETHHFNDPYMVKNPGAAINPVNNDYGEVSPRFGFAWTPFHDSDKTVLRGGVGVFYDVFHTAQAGTILNLLQATYPLNLNYNRPSLNPYCLGYVTCSGGVVPTLEQQYVQIVLAQALANYSLPLFNLGTYTVGGKTYTVPAPTLGPGGTGGPVNVTGGTIGYDQDWRTPGEIQFSGGVEHQFSDLDVAVDYVYTRGFNQLILRNANISQQNTLLNTNYGGYTSFTEQGYFTDHSVRMKIAYRDHRQDMIQVANTLGWARDNSIGGYSFSSASTPATDPYNFAVDYGPSSNDARDILNVLGAIHIPWGFIVSPILSYTSPLPYTASTTLAVAGCPSYYNQCYPPGYTKNSLRGASTTLINARVAKNIHLGESRSVSLFMEGYNLENRQNYGTNYQAAVTSSKFGQPTGDAANMRQLQAGARFDF